MSDANQLQLIPDEPLPDPIRRDVYLAALPTDIAAPEPDPEMVNSIVRWGVIEPIILLHPEDWDKETISGIRVEDGRGRILAARKAGLVMIPAHFYPIGLFAPGILTIVLARNRRENRIAELEIVEGLLAQQVAIEDICRATGKTRAEIDSLLKLQQLAPPLRQALRDNKMTTSSATRAARLIPAQQERLAAQLVEAGKLTGDDVDGARRTERQAAAETIPWESLMPAPPPESWSDILSARLSRLLADMPMGTPRYIYEAINDILLTLQGPQVVTLEVETETQETPPAPPPQHAPYPAQPEQRTTPKPKPRRASASANLLKLIPTMDKEIDRKRSCNAGVNLTHKRLGEQTRAHAEADSLEIQKRIILAIAEQQEAGTFPTLLEMVHTRDHLSSLAGLVRPLQEGHRPNSPGDPYYWSAEAWLLNTPIPRINTVDYFHTARCWVLEALDGHTDNALAVERKLDLAEKELCMGKIPDFFPTPQSVIQKMMGLADIRSGHTVLEPSAGSGAIARALREAGAGQIDLWCIEINHRLQEHLVARGFWVAETRDFLKHTLQGVGYDRIVMNPPFTGGADVEHVQHAFDLLNPGGRVVSVMSTSWQHNSAKKFLSFREWSEDRNMEVYPLPDGSFDQAMRSTGVSTCIVVLDRPKD